MSTIMPTTLSRPETMSSITADKNNTIKKTYVINFTSANFDLKYLNKNVATALEYTQDFDCYLLNREQSGISIRIQRDLDNIDYLSDYSMNEVISEILEHSGYIQSDLCDCELSELDQPITIIIPNDAMLIAKLSYKIGSEGWRYYTRFNILVQRMSGLYCINPR